MSGRKYKFLLFLSGQFQIYLITVLSLTSVFAVQNYSIEFIIKSVALITCIRFAFYLTRAPKPVLEIYSIRKRLKRLIEDEGKTSLTFAALCFFLQLPLFSNDLLTALLTNVGGQLCGLMISSEILKYLNKNNQTDMSDQKVLIIGTGKNAKKAADALLDAPECVSTLSGFLDYSRKNLWSYREIPLIGHPSELDGLIAHSQIDLLIVALENEELPLSHALFDTAEKMGVAVCFMPELFHPTITNAKPTFINAMPMMLYRAIPDNQLKLFIKTTFDKIGALAGIVLSLPFMILTALAIKIEDRGPIFFKQMRSGINGKQFYLYKFRTMCIDAETKKAELAQLNEMSGPVFKIKNDPRVTKVGTLLRKTSMDELPQFFNVFKGDMSLVGPRPPLPKEVVQYEPWQHRRLSVKPGVTCTWQVNGRNNIDFDEWMKLDLEYIDNWSLWNDTKIIAKTIPAVLKGSGAS